MCACEPGYLCPRCAGTPADPGYLYEPDPRERAERDRYQAEITTEGPLGLAAFYSGRYV